MKTDFPGLWKLTRGNLHSPLWLSTISSVVCTDVCVSVCVCVCVCVRVSDCTQFLMLPQFSLEIGFTMSSVPALEPLATVFVRHRKGGREQKQLYRLAQRLREDDHVGWPVKFCVLFFFVIHFVQADKFRTGDHFFWFTGRECRDILSLCILCRGYQWAHRFVWPGLLCLRQF